MVVGRLSSSSMSPIIQQVLLPKIPLASGITQTHCPTNVPDRVSSYTDSTLAGSVTSASYEEISNIPLYQRFLRSSYNLERFLDFVSIAFDEMDYCILRDNLSLPKKTLKQPDDLNCGCEGHKERAGQSNNEGPRNFWRTWDKMVRCAGKLKLNRNPSEILMELSETSRMLGCQRNFQFNLDITCSR